MTEKITPFFMYFGHHRCASTWVKSILRPIVRDMGWKASSFHSPSLFNHDLEFSIIDQNLDFIFYINATYQYTSELTIPYKGFHVIRDPRDIIVSSYFSSLNSHPTNQWPELIPHRQRLQEVSKADGIFLEMEFMQNVLEDIASWNYAQPNVLELRYEDVTIAPYQAFVDIFQFLGCLDEGRITGTKRLTYAVAAPIRRRTKLLPKGRQVPVEILLGRVYENSFTKKTAGRTRGEEDIHSHYRKGRAGDWKNHFNADHKAFFKEKYGDLVVKLGYEKGNDW